MNTKVAQCTEKDVVCILILIQVKVNLRRNKCLCKRFMVLCKVQSITETCLNLLEFWVVSLSFFFFFALLPRYILGG